MSALLLPYRGVLPRIAEGAFVAPTATIVGDVEIGTDSGIWFGCVLRGDVNYIRVGKRTNIQDGTIVHVAHETYPTLIGNDITIGHSALIHACTLEDGCFIGMRATVMDGAVVEKDAMVAAGALVAPGKRIATGQLWAGVPARYLRDLTDADREEFNAIGPRYVDLAREHLKSLG